MPLDVATASAIGFTAGSGTSMSCSDELTWEVTTIASTVPRTAVPSELPICRAVLCSAEAWPDFGVGTSHRVTLVSWALARP